MVVYFVSFFFFFNDTATTEIYTLSLHDALPISQPPPGALYLFHPAHRPQREAELPRGDRKSTRLNSSHLVISYAVFCLKKKKQYFNLVHAQFWSLIHTLCYSLPLITSSSASLIQ